jgi:hypothetical protein
MTAQVKRYQRETCTGCTADRPRRISLRRSSASTRCPSNTSAAGTVTSTETAANATTAMPE